MKETYNWKSLFAGLGIIIVGIILCLVSPSTNNPWDTVWLSIGCSLIASGLVILMHDFFVERKAVSELNEWKITKIYSTRAERNAEADPNIESARYCIDGIAFGLSTFRNIYGKKIEQCLKKGVQIRLLTMDPDGLFIEYREEEENAGAGGIKDTIVELVKWADSLNQLNAKGKIVVKAYKSMTLDYYWRVDDDLYVGPYWYGYKSSDTITYKFVAGGRGYQHYGDYFEKLWDDKELCRVLTKVNDVSRRKVK
jgi:hypothetical protein